MLFKYEAVDSTGKPQVGTVNAATEDSAVLSLQRRGFTITSIKTEHEGGFLGTLTTTNISIFNGVSNRDVVLLSREIATLFEAQVSALRVFQLLAEQTEKAYLREVLINVADDLQAGSSLSLALAKYPKVFSDFYVNMVRAGEETGKLDETFLFLADYLDRSFELTSKAKNALIYPAFVLGTFVVVMLLMLTVVIPKLSAILTDAGGEIPLYTQVVIAASNFLVDYGIFILIFLIIGGYGFYRWAQTPTGRVEVDRFRMGIPYVGDLYQKLYIARIADNLHVMLSSGISAVRALEITASVMESRIYKDALMEAVQEVKSGTPMSVALAKHPREMPRILTQMTQIGEETGELGNILSRLAKFYQREVNMAVDALVNLIEPVLIVLLAVGVGFLLASILIPIYNIGSNI